MKIALVAPESTPVPPKQYGGIEWVVYCLGKGLEQIGQDVTVVCRDSSTYEGKTIISDIWTPNENKILNYLDHMGDISHFDVVHDHMTGATGQKGKVNPDKVLTTLHWNHSGLAADFYNINAISYSQRQWVLNEWKTTFKMTGGKGKIKDCPVVYHGLIPEMFKMNNNKDYILFLSRLDSSKGVDIALDIAKRMPEETFMFAGQASNFTGIVERASQKHENIIFLGEVGQDKKFELFANAKAFLFPTGGYNQIWQEPFGIVQLEANLSGLPIIAYPNGETPYIVEEGINGWLCKTVDEFINKIKNIESDFSSKQKIRDYAKTRFSHVAMAKNYLNLYNKLME